MVRQFFLWIFWDYHDFLFFYDGNEYGIKISDFDVMEYYGNLLILLP
jgi:hypothetical protein